MDPPNCQVFLAPRCGFEGVVEVNRARRVSPLELRCVAPSRTVGFGRVFLMHKDSYGELTVRHHGMLELEAWTKSAGVGSVAVHAIALRVCYTLGNP